MGDHPCLRRRFCSVVPELGSKPGAKSGGLFFEVLLRRSILPCLAAYDGGYGKICLPLQVARILRSGMGQGLGIWRSGRGRDPCSPAAAGLCAAGQPGAAVPTCAKGFSRRAWKASRAQVSCFSAFENRRTVSTLVSRKTRPSAQCADWEGGSVLQRLRLDTPLRHEPDRYSQLLHSSQIALRTALLAGFLISQDYVINCAIEELVQHLM